MNVSLDNSSCTADYCLARENVTFKEIYPLIVDPYYQKTASYEHFDHVFWRLWFERNWTIGIYIGLTYICVIFGLKRWMRDREAYELKRPLILWNAAMAIFSAVAVYRFHVHLVHVLATEGFHHSVCNRGNLTMTQQYWTLLGLWSKVAELGDTVFIVLRKRKLIFLHWYHHAIIVAICFYDYDKYDPITRWYFNINISIHAIMYSYYAVRAAGIYVPKLVSMMITRIQLVQFVSGFLFSMYSLWALSTSYCERNVYEILFVELPVGISFFLLFANYYRNAYIKGEKDRKPPAKKTEKLM